MRWTSQTFRLVDLCCVHVVLDCGRVFCASSLPMKNRLRILRAELDWSQAQLADRVGVARQTIIALEAGKYAPSLPLAFKLSRVFNKPVEEVFIPEPID